MTVQREKQLLEDVLASFDAKDERLQTIVEAATRHLHAFVREVGLTHSEWDAGIRFLTAVGQTCTPERQEMVLLSDVLGVSSQMELTSAPSDDEATTNTVLGPFYVPGSPWRDEGASILESGDPGPRVTMRGCVRDTAGRPITGATVDVWQNASNKLYAVQDPEQDPNNLRGRFRTSERGSFSFFTVRPVAYAIPDDGPVGRFLDLVGRHPWRPAHIHFLVTAPGFDPLTTHVFDRDSDYLDSDAVFGVEESLVTTFEAAGHQRGALDAEFDFVLTASRGRIRPDREPGRQHDAHP
jgi:protocatechuate 3,4-dioxygenase beta subunit